MKILFLSDLHFEFWNHEENIQNFIEKSKKETNANIIILAGDICSHDFILHYLKSFFDNFEYVIYVPGNHEFYDSSLQKIRELKNFVPNNCYWLDNSRITIEDKKFIGCTLWFPFHEKNWLFQPYMGDFKWIKNLPEDLYDENKESVKYLNDNIQKNDIVVTHHLPCMEAVADQFKNNILNRFFVCPMNGIIKNKEPKLWIHGHSHDNIDFYLHKTRIIRNPYCYPNERLEKFEFRTIDI